ncbi:hypothetical protein GCM10011488_27320 [Steroidobacter agaridevorans]|nr:hypothetical protein GCM10011488_27320 [Steroidobacter agaridevorans]
MGADPYTESNLPAPSANGRDGSRHPQSFASLFDINRQTIALLMDVAATPVLDRTWSGWRMLGNELMQLEANQRESLARCPFSLIDVGLREVPDCAGCDSAPDGPIQGELMFSLMTPQTRLHHLAHAALLFSWHLVRSDLIAARLVFAMDSATTSFMARVTLSDIRRIAQERVRNGCVGPRWHDRPAVWLRLIHMARSPQNDDFATVSTRGLQLFLQELVTNGRRR